MGVEADAEATAPAGWTKWIVPGFEALKVKVESPTTFADTIAYLNESKLELSKENNAEENFALMEEKHLRDQV